MQAATSAYSWLGYSTAYAIGSMGGIQAALAGVHALRAVTSLAAAAASGGGWLAASVLRGVGGAYRHLTTAKKEGGDGGGGRLGPHGRGPRGPRRKVVRDQGVRRY